MSLKSDVYRLLNDTQLICADIPEAYTLYSEIEKMKERLNQPLRAAIVGIMKAGKSTFMNALMGKNIVGVGTLETTYTVSWFKYADEPSLTIYFRNGEERCAPFEELEKWSVRESGNPEIDNVKYLVINYPSDILKKIEFIDTPGLNSVYGTDAQNTLDFLAIRSSEETVAEASMADAVIYAFNRSLAGEDARVLQSFHAGDFSNHSPLNSIGILTKVDMTGAIYDWPDGSPVKGAEVIVNASMANPMIKKILYAIFPVCSVAVEGCSVLTEEDWDVLGNISHTDPEMLMDLLWDATEFSVSENEEFMVLGSPAIRRRLIDVLGQYGIFELARQLREGRSPDEARQILTDKCGITAVKDVILSHFGNRTFIIKVGYIFNHLRALVERFEKDPVTGFALKNICYELKNNIDDILSNQQRMQELKVVQMYYNEQLVFNSDIEKEDFLHITGEYGQSVEDRLGVDGTCSIRELKKIAGKKMAQWRYNANSFMGNHYYIEAANIITRSYEHIFYALNALDEV
ncbi:MAG: dynamin family protein [Oscillospiraceae bacterium]|nr:dynamin family protein [Oscillospiraceae bacterium]